MSQSPSEADGLEGIIVAETVLSRVDGEGGRLWIRGRDIEEVADSVPFEGICRLLWDGDADGDRSGLAAALGQGRLDAFRRLGRLGDALALADPMDAMRAAMSHLEPAGDDATVRAWLTGALAVFVAAWARRHLGAGTTDPIAPDPSLGHAEDLLRMVDGEHPAAARVRALDSYLATAAEHGMNASTFAARVVASTGSDTVSAVVAAIGALKGPLHGGVPGPVLEMFDAIGHPDRAAAWLTAELDAGRRIMGMGHRVYRVRDPRAAVFEKAVERLERAGVASDRLAFARAVEREALGLLRARHPDRPLEANVEFYTAVLLDAVGLDRALFTPVFATARIAGWLAHVAEQRSTGRLIRPKARYVGPVPAAA